MNYKARYDAAAHAVQSGIAMSMAFDPKPTEPKHLRTGLDCGKADMEGLVTLLIAKGVFSQDEYSLAMVEAMEREKGRYEAALSLRMGKKVTLG